MTDELSSDRTPAFWRDVIAALPDGLAIIATDGTLLEVNDAFCSLVGFGRGELLGRRPPFPHWPEEDFEALSAIFRRTLRGEVTHGEIRIVTKSGARFPVLLHVSPLRDAKGTIVGHVATMKDIRERLQMEEALRRSEERWRSIAENPYDFVTIIDLDYRYIYVNHTAEGIDPTALLGKMGPLDFVAEEHRPGLHTAFEKVIREGIATMFEAYTPQTECWYSTIVAPIFDQGKVSSLCLLTRNITEAKRVEENLRHAQKVETLGTLAGGIAHDMNNLLAPILGNAELALRATPRESPVRPWLEDVVGAATRAKAIVSRILVFGRRTHETRRPVAMPELLQEALRFLANSLPATIEVAVQVDPSCPPVLGLAEQIHQAITNLCANAYQALKATGGHVMIRLAQLTLDESTARGLNMEPGQAVCLLVQDDGPGMSSEVRARIFEPFFTTKPVGEGSGLGLAIVETIMRRHGGAVTVHSQVGLGTTFTLYFPAYDGPLRNASTVPTAGIQRRGQRILCVDDEPAVLRLTARVLSGAGYAVVTATSVHDALELVRKDPSAFDLIITDETMPKLTGTQLAARIAPLRPELPVVIISGYGDDDRSAEEPPNVRARLRKPLGIDELVTALDVVLVESAPDAPS